MMVLARLAARVCLTLTLFVMVATTGALAANGKTRPNIILMLSDNVGYGELGSYGGGVIRGAPTPNLDRLAAEGTRFANFNVETECTPSRSALMTGRLPIRSGTGRAGLPGFPQGLSPWEYTMAEMLSDQGYKTAIFGKWHLGQSAGRYPTDQGFDVWWGFPFSTDVVYQFDALGYDGDPETWPYVLEAVRDAAPSRVARYDREMRGKMDQLIADKSVAYIEDHAQTDEPFFLFIGWSHMHHPYVPHPDFKDKTGHGDFADMMVEHDYRVGQVMAALEKSGRADNTIIIYASDNGPDAAEYPRVSNQGPFRGYLGSAYEGSIRTPMIIKAPGRVPAGRVTNEIVSILDFFPTLASLTGGKVPSDRDYDGKDQLAFFEGKTDQSSRDTIITFIDKKLLGLKWKNYKIYLTDDDPGAVSRVHKDLWAVKIFDVAQDPREETDIYGTNLWMLRYAVEPVMRLAGSIYQYGAIKTGDDYRSPYMFTIPPAFNSPEEVKRILLKLQELQSQQKKPSAGTDK